RRPASAGSSQRPAESSSFTYGPTVRPRLLSTPLHSDAVTLGYGAVAYSDTDFHRADVAPSRAHDSRVRGNDGSKREHHVEGHPSIFILRGRARGHESLVVKSPLFTTHFFPASLCASLISLAIGFMSKHSGAHRGTYS